MCMQFPSFMHGNLISKNVTHVYYKFKSSSYFQFAELFSNAGFRNILSFCDDILYSFDKNHKNYYQLWLPLSMSIHKFSSTL